MIEKFIEIHISLIKEARKLTFRRYLYNNIDWNNRLIGIIGARGVGKTTLLLQYCIEYFDNPEDGLYLSADNINIASKGLYNLAEEFFNFGGKVLLIDEVQKYPNWQQELKNLYDSFPSKKVIFSGSSSINILKGKSDLSRRVIFYKLKGLSFREFLLLHTGKSFEKLKMEEILTNHVKIAGDISNEIPILRYYNEYLKFGYYPFFKEGINTFYGKLDNVVDKIFYEDIPLLFNVKPDSIYNLKKLFYLVATSQPFTPNISRLSSQLGISKEYIYIYIDELEKAGLFNLLYSNTTGFNLLRKPQKIYLENVNLFTLIEKEKGFGVEKGSTRETFFLNQVSEVVRLFFPDKTDFMDNTGRYFEVGGKGKTDKVKNIESTSKNHFTICDDINIGFKNKIPLWVFGFLY
ncbi:ATP-binding protein [Candidatus Desantisbacteria bacterium]|nr:ATP-binding protein [Candidatus Desantisbacteria bacterium]